jgi:hypothetical protein
MDAIAGLGRRGISHGTLLDGDGARRQGGDPGGAANDGDDEDDQFGRGEGRSVLLTRS